MMQTLEGFWRSTQVLHSWLDTILPGRPCILYTIPAHPPRTVWQKHHLLQQQNYTCLNATLFQNILHASLVFVNNASIFRLDSLPLKCSQEELECLCILFHKPSFLKICYTFHSSWIWCNLLVLLNKQKLSLWAFKFPPNPTKKRESVSQCSIVIPPLRYEYENGVTVRPRQIYHNAIWIWFLNMYNNLFEPNTVGSAYSNL